LRLPMFENYRSDLLVMLEKPSQASLQWDNHPSHRVLRP
jgi:hypothetical protein